MGGSSYSLITKGSKECSGGWKLNVGGTLELFLNAIIFLYKICNRSVRGANGDFPGAIPLTDGSLILVSAISVGLHELPSQLYMSALSFQRTVFLFPSMSTSLLLLQFLP